ncbi:unnamed protein product [Dicrocoelium dendriticum]|nr:unnamed protein product [Dicrocoelium dendriticum]
MQMPDTNDHPVTEIILFQLLWIQGTLEFERSNCTQRGFPMYDPESEVWNFVIWINENRMPPLTVLQ